MFFVFAAQDSTECSTNNKTLKALFFTRQQGEREFTIVRASQTGQEMIGFGGAHNKYRD